MKPNWFLKPPTRHLYNVMYAKDEDSREPYSWRPKQTEDLVMTNEEWQKNCAESYERFDKWKAKRRKAQRKRLWKFTVLVLISPAILLTLFFCLYKIKCALGIDIFPNSHLSDYIPG